MVMMMMMMAKVMTLTYIMAMFTIIDDEDDHYAYMNINLGQSHRNNCELDHLQDVDMSNGVDRDGDYDNDDKSFDNVDGHIDIDGPSGSYNKNFRYIGLIKASAKSGELGFCC